VPAHQAGGERVEGDFFLQSRYKPEPDGGWMASAMTAIIRHAVGKVAAPIIFFVAFVQSPDAI